MQTHAKTAGRTVTRAAFLALMLYLAVAASRPAPAGTPLARGGALWEVSRARPAVLLPVPLVRQGRDNTCGVSCVQAILRYAGYEFDSREDTLAVELGTAEDGTPLQGMVDALNRASRPEVEGGGRVLSAEARENMTVADLIRAVDAGRPVICLLQAWRLDDAGLYPLRTDYAGVWDSGHYAVAVGYDAERVYFMDPSTLGNYTYIPRDELDARWHGAGEATKEGIERLEHAGIVVTVAAPRYFPCEFYKLQ